ncbi:NUDIX hydrolase [Paracoccus sp. ME4]|uniref:NUDIX hydrolase n=1 Tax=Paracoccus sp. ME4 TaxID=3138066 RepID=UPI00398AE03F
MNTQQVTGPEWRPIATVDVVLMTIREERLEVLILRRAAGPFAGEWALPGGYLRPEEDMSVEAAAERVLREKAGLPPQHLEQLQVFSGPDRDPRGWSISCALLALVPCASIEGAIAEGCRLQPVDDLLQGPGLAFDHDLILGEAIRRLRGKGGYSTLPAALVGDEFTLSELRGAYEVVLGIGIDKAVFRKRMLDLGVLEETGRTTRIVPNSRPAMTYRLRDGVRTFDRQVGSASSPVRPEGKVRYQP